jgi:uncharacterized protein (UPF0332 family)
MRFDPKGFIQVSKDLKKGASEAHYRSIINRAYYGAFGYIRNSLNIFVKDHSVHQEVINTLKRSSSLNMKKAGKRLEALFKKRKEADYIHNLEIKEHNCLFCVQEAEEIISLYDSEDED